MKRFRNILKLIFIFSITQRGFSTQIEKNVHQDISLRKEIQHAIEKGLLWLKENQNESGFWSQPDHPALTGLVLTAFMGEPSGKFKSEDHTFIKMGYEYMISCVQPDGGIYVRDLANYNTAVCMMALQSAHNPDFKTILINSRKFLVSLQGDFNEKGEIDSPYDGGMGYGSRYTHSDMSNTVLALEALYYTKYLKQDDPDFKALNWDAVIKFIERCQNLPEFNDQSWATGDSLNRGGFIYFPGNSKAGEMTLKSGMTALRSYGSMSYAGLLSCIYAEMDRSDPRIKAVFDWLQENYTLEENPGMDQQGLYYYYHTMAKTLSIYGVDKLVLKNHREIYWRKELALKLFDLQDGQGFWVNISGRWWEKDPVLVTSYALIALEIIYRSL